MEEKLIQGMWSHKDDQLVFLWVQGYVYFWKKTTKNTYRHEEWSDNGRILAGQVHDGRGLEKYKQVLKEELVSW